MCCFLARWSQKSFPYTFLELFNREDEFYWSGSSDENFSVKSAYFVAVNIKWDNMSGEGDCGIWKKLWSLNIPPKFALFLWKVIHRILPIKHNLVRRGGYAGMGCVRFVSVKINN